MIPRNAAGRNVHCEKLGLTRGQQNYGCRKREGHISLAPSADDMAHDHRNNVNKFVRGR